MVQIILCQYHIKRASDSKADARNLSHCLLVDRSLPPVGLDSGLHVSLPARGPIPALRAYRLFFRYCLGVIPRIL